MFSIYWLAFKSNQILLLKWDNKADLATTPRLHDGQGVRNKVQGCLLSAAVRHLVSISFAGQLGEAFPWRRRRPCFSYSIVQSSLFPTALVQFPQAAFYVPLYLFASEAMCVLVLWGVRSGLPGNAIVQWGQRLLKAMLSNITNSYQEWPCIFAMSYKSIINLRKNAVFPEDLVLDVMSLLYCVEV